VSREKENWRMPKKGIGNTIIVGKRIQNEIKSPYDDKKPPFCYPGTLLSGNVMGRATYLLSKQFNAIGCHTQEEEGEGGFDATQRYEATAIRRIASMIGGTKETIDGYFCGGGTEANIEGLWIGRQYLRQFPDPMHRGIVILTTQLVHYSIFKACELLDIGHSKTIDCTRCGENHIFIPDPSGSGVNLVGINKQGEMSTKQLRKVFKKKYQEGFRQFMIVPTIGTCVMGSVDPVGKIGKFIREMNKKTGVGFYMHVDASFAGFTIPFVKPGLKLWFNVPEVMSITIDGDKMGQLPYPAGIFLCRKKLMDLVGRKVNYIGGHKDITVSGSRSCLSPIIYWYLSETEGVLGQKRYVQKCLDGRNKLVKLIKEHQSNQTGLAWITVHPCHPYVNFVPLELNIYKGKVPNIVEKKGLLANYHLRSDFFPSDPEDPNSCPRTIYKVCIMYHNLKSGVIENFVKDLAQAETKWRKNHSE